MALALTAFGLFTAAFLLHLAWWRIRLPRRQLPTLFKLLMGFFPIGLLGLRWLAVWPAEWLLSPASAVVALIYTSLSITYVITYSAIEGDSPTLSLLRWVAAHPDGVDEKNLTDFMAERPFIQARIHALFTDNLIEERNGRLRIKGRPSLFFRLILAWRTLYGPMEKGG